MLHYYSKNNCLPSLSPVKGLKIRECDDPLLMSVIGSISLEEARNRMANDHKAYVAYLHGIPAAFGWMAMGKASIGELHHEFILPLRHRYLWNFRTLADFRGLGIYPHLLQHILKAEEQTSDCFWIMHAPENKASARGIGKAGFHRVGQVSVMGGKGVAFEGVALPSGLEAVLDVIGFVKADTPAATCWNCSSPYIKNRVEGCCCSKADTACNAHLFQTA